MERIPGEHTARDALVGLGHANRFAVDPSPNAPQHSATVEDYLETSESGDRVRVLRRRILSHGESTGPGMSNLITRIREETTHQVF